MPLGKDQAFTWAYNSLSLEVDWTLWWEVGDFKAYLQNILNYLKLA